MDILGTVLLIAGIAVVVLSWLLAMQHFEFRRMVLSRSREYRRTTIWNGPPVTLVVPVKGSDPGMRQNLAALFEQDYPDYEVAFVVEDSDEPAAQVIQGFLRDPGSVPARMIVAGRGERVGQKVHNLLKAVESLPDRTKVLAFVDADARPAPSWLRVLVNRYRLPGVGAITGYRWMVPQRRTLPNLLVASANGGVAALCGRHSHNVVWGGSWAIRRETFESQGIAAAWSGKLTEDVVATGVLRQAGLRVEFEPGCICASPLDMNWRQAFSFMRRQFLLVRMYSPLLWTLGLLYTTVLQAGFWGSGLAALILLAVNNRLWTVAAAACAILYALSMARGWLRQSAARNCLGKALDDQDVERWFDILAAPLSNLFAWSALVGSALVRSAQWRGIRYELDGRGQVVNVVREDEAGAGTMALTPSDNTRRLSDRAAPQPASAKRTAA
jgi:ceramide glucosyltransferase